MVNELRHDPLTGRHVLIAENRAERPGSGILLNLANEFGLQEQPRRAVATECPFCAGHETETPREVDRCCDDTGAWSVRVVPNKYPALRLAAEGVDNFESASSTESAPAYGAQEVIVESPQHIARPSQLDERSHLDVLEIWQRRLAYWRKDGRFAWGCLFRNVGRRAGASLEHLHSQLIVMPEVPAGVAQEHEVLAARAGRECPFCEQLLEQCEGDGRMVGATSAFVAICPYVSRQPLEMWILPRKHQSHFDQLTYEQRADLQVLLGRLFRTLESLVPDVAYNVIVRTARFDTFAADRYHWRIEIVPRITQEAGFELGGGPPINPIAPERAAELLRETTNKLDG